MNLLLSRPIMKIICSRINATGRRIGVAGAVLLCFLAFFHCRAGSERLYHQARRQWRSDHYGFILARVGAVAIPSTVEGKSVTAIGDDAFDGNTSLTSVTIASGIIGIGNAAFADCLNLDSVTIPDTVATIGEAAFVSCAFTSLTIPNRRDQHRQ